MALGIGADRDVETADAADGLGQFRGVGVAVGARLVDAADAGAAGRVATQGDDVIDAGATRAVSQFFFDIDAFLRFRDRVRAAGVTIPLIPGIMPVSNFAGLQRMCGSCGTSVPDWLAAHFDGLDDDPETRKLLAASVAAETCARLQEEGFSDFHFYTLNRADLVYAICRVLGVREQKAAA